MLYADKSVNDNTYYKMVVRIERIYAVEYGVDPRGNKYAPSSPDYEENQND